MLNDKSRGWEGVDSAVKQLEELVSENNLPGDRPDTLRKLEDLVEGLSADGHAVGKCGELRRIARGFYTERRRTILVAEMERAHWPMVARI